MVDGSDATDLLYGVEAISKCLNMTTAQVYHLHARGQIPTFKIGKKVCSRRASLSTWLAEQEAKAKAPSIAGPEVGNRK
ncbi:DNA-binding protein [Ancylobacter sp. IITR112]|uniref:DNA-binding protein n=1 Tax=Ancylobacter sp. IITR112 TaxID=3138073 RepID=UPI003529F1DE